MSDSLRDQLLQAGFSAPRKSPPQSRKSNHKRQRPAGSAATARSSNPHSDHPGAPHSAPAPAPAVGQPQRQKAIKAEIKALIEDSAHREYQGESIYRYLLNNRIRELHVNEEVRARLVAGSLVITRLNGATWLVPEATGAAIRTLNPDWAIVTRNPDAPDDTAGYEDFPVPDDLQW